MLSDMTFALDSPESPFHSMYLRMKEGNEIYSPLRNLTSEETSVSTTKGAWSKSEGDHTMGESEGKRC